MQLTRCVMALRLYGNHPSIHYLKEQYYIEVSKCTLQVLLAGLASHMEQMYINLIKFVSVLCEACMKSIQK